MNLNIPKIDSTRLLIPIELVELNPYHQQFLREVVTINTDGEYFDKRVIKSYRLHSNPCSSHYNSANMIDNGVSVPVVKVGFSSKIIESFYFDGINKMNIDKVVDFINQEGVIKVSKETILNSRFVDTDICIDMVLQSTTNIEFVKFCNQISTLRKGTNPNPFTDIDNVGIEWSHRLKVKQSYRTKQFLKFYDKHLELNNKSKVFYDTYLKNNPSVKLVPERQLRMETTIKNSAHWKTYGIELKTFKDLLELDLTKHPELFERPLNHYLDGQKQVKHSKKLSPTQRMKVMLIREFMGNNDVDEINAIEMICNELYPLGIKKNVSPRSREKKVFLKLFLENKKEQAELLDERQLNIISELQKIGLE